MKYLLAITVICTIIALIAQSWAIGFFAALAGFLLLCCLTIKLLIGLVDSVEAVHKNDLKKQGLSDAEAEIVTQLRMQRSEQF